MTTRQITSSFLSVALLWTAFTSARGDTIRWRSNLDAAKIEATESKKLVLLHFWTPSCGPCKTLERNVFSQPQIGDVMERDYVPVKINANGAPALAGAYRIDRVPADIVLTPQGGVVASLSCPSAAADYSAQLTNVAQHYRQRTAGRNASTESPVQAAYSGLKIGQYNKRPPAQPVSSYSVAVGVAPPPVTINPYAAKPPQPAPPQTAPPAFSAVASTGGQTPTVQANVGADRYAPVSQAPGAAQPPVATATAPPAQTIAPQQQAAAQQQQLAQQQQVLAPQQQLQAQQQTVAVAKRPVGTKAIAGPTVPPQLPAGTPPLAFDGYCPVTLKTARKWVAGDLKFGVIHRGLTFLFTSEAQRQQFLANPDAYSPVFSGMDPVKLLDDNEQVAGSRRFGFEFRGAIYLFSCQETMKRFESQPNRYAASVRQAMNRFDSNLGTVHQ